MQLLLMLIGRHVGTCPGFMLFASIKSLFYRVSRMRLARGGSGYKPKTKDEFPHEMQRCPLVRQGVSSDLCYVVLPRQGSFTVGNQQSSHTRAINEQTRDAAQHCIPSL